MAPKTPTNKPRAKNGGNGNGKGTSRSSKKVPKKLTWIEETMEIINTLSNEGPDNLNLRGKRRKDPALAIADVILKRVLDRINGPIQREGGRGIAPVEPELVRPFGLDEKQVVMDLIDRMVQAYQKGYEETVDKDKKGRLYGKLQNAIMARTAAELQFKKLDVDIKKIEGMEYGPISPMGTKPQIGHESTLNDPFQFVPLFMYEQLEKKYLTVLRALIRGTSERWIAQGPLEHDYCKMDETIVDIDDDGDSGMSDESMVDLESITPTVLVNVPDIDRYLEILIEPSHFLDEPRCDVIFDGLEEVPDPSKLVPSPSPNGLSPVPTSVDMDCTEPWVQSMGRGTLVWGYD